MTSTEIIIGVAINVVGGIVIICAEVFWLNKLMRRIEQSTRERVLRAMSRHYLCGYSLEKMIEAEFMNRFGELNNEGFCYTFSAAIMLAMKGVKTARIVRGHVVDNGEEGNHSWVEFRSFGRWWVVDPCWLTTAVVFRSWYYSVMRPQVSVRYTYREIWNDPAAEIFYQRISRPESSRVFVNLYCHYTPERGGEEPWISNLVDGPAMPLPEKPMEYFKFGAGYDFQFSQRIVDELMANSDE